MPAGLAAVVALVALAARNLGETWLPRWAYVPVNALVGACLLGLGRRAGANWEELGLARQHLRRGARLGAVTGAAAAAVVGAAAVLPGASRVFDDARVPAGAGSGELAYQTAVRIPAGTAAFEELAFRGVLLALLARVLPRRTAVAADAAVFGLWHVAPTLATGRANGLAGLPLTGLVVAAVVATAMGGVGFCVLRLRGGHLAAPALVHLALNDAGYLAAWLLRR